MGLFTEEAGTKASRAERDTRPGETDQSTSANI